MTDEEIAEALVSTAPTCRAEVAPNRLPSLPGLYAIFVDSPTALPAQFGERLNARGSRLIYIGIATTSLLLRLGEQDLRHRQPSTFFRSIGAVLSFRPPAGSLVGKKNQNNFTFSPSDTAAIIEWINTHLSIRWYQISPAPASAEATAIRMHRPLLNTIHNPEPVVELAKLRNKCRMLARTPPSPRRPTMEPTALVLKITLRGLQPPVWRRVHVAVDTTLGTLHQVIQAAMGWHNSHLHEFEIGNRRYGEPDDDPWPGAERIYSETNVKLGALIGQGVKRFRYVYDFGDNWEHEVLVEKIEPLVPDQQYPSLITGKRACPPEDCGGIHGYLHLIEVLADPSDEEHAELREWVGGTLEPEHFDLEASKRDLARLARRQRA